jgi:(E)-4-hydroxy-3-methylbut-2-enyl-diphosphate synthase
VNFEIPGTLGIIVNSEKWKLLKNTTRRYPVFCGNEIFTTDKKSPELNFVAADIKTLSPEFIDKLKGEKNIVLVLHTSNEHAMPEERRAFISLMENNCTTPVIIKRSYKGMAENLFLLYSATDLGALFLEGMGDGTWISSKNAVSVKSANSTSFGILQATRTRISKTEYISCPSCGRTLFDLQETTNKIRQRTEHLKGVKIGIMGCIVNGPGEMADADYGYVGTGPGKITLYKGKEVVKKNIEEKEAVDALVELIREHGDWVEKI